MIWLIGNKGMLGTELSLILEQNNMAFLGTDKEIDITDLQALKRFSENKNINWIINCAAYTAVDKAEDDIETCRSLNVTGTANIAICAKDISANFIHISTDYVFNGSGNKPYLEEDPTDPIGAYGLSKRDGEIKVLQENKNSYIIRTSWLYGKHGNNFVHTMLRLMNEKTELKVVNDQRGNPTWTYDLANVLLSIVKADEAEKKIPYGIYNYSNEGNITWFDFANEIYRQGSEAGKINNTCTVTACTSAEFPAKVKRPAYSVLDKSKIKSALKIEIPLWEKSLKEFLQNA